MLGESISQVSNDVSATCGILAQLRELAQPKLNADGVEFCIFTEEGLKTLRSATNHCNSVFVELKRKLESASKQMAGMTSANSKIELSLSEKAKWPLHQKKDQEGLD